MPRQDECSKLVASWCKWWINAIVTVAYWLAFMLLSRDRPTFYLDDFHVASLNKTVTRPATNTTTTTIYFDLRINNTNGLVGIYYENPLNLTFTYFPPNYNTTTNTAATIGEYTIEPFYQGNGKVRHVRDFVVVQDLFSSAAVDDGRFRELGEADVSLAGPAKVVVFGVDLEAKVKFKSIDDKRSDLKVGGTVELNGNTGDVVLKKTVELKYDSGSNEWGVVQWILYYPLALLFGMIGMACCVFLPIRMIDPDYVL